MRRCNDSIPSCLNHFSHHSSQYLGELFKIGHIIIAIICNFIPLFVILLDSPFTYAEICVIFVFVRWLRCNSLKAFFISRNVFSTEY